MDARLAGFQSDHLSTLVFMTTSGLAAFAGIISAGMLGSAEKTAGTGVKLGVIAAVIILV
jgi:ribose transport system permease protein